MHVDTGVDTSLCQVPSVNAIECAPSQFQSSCRARMSDLCSWIKTSLVLRDWSLCRLSGSKAILSQSGTKVVAFLIATRHLTFLRWLMLAP